MIALALKYRFVFAVYCINLTLQFVVLVNIITTTTPYQTVQAQRGYCSVSTPF